MSTPSATLASAGSAAGNSGGRVFRGRTVEQLIPQIEAELGPDAVVLRRRSGLEGGVGGFFQRPFVEIEAQRGGRRVDIYDGGAEAPSPQPQTPAQGIEALSASPADGMALDQAAAGRSASRATPFSELELATLSSPVGADGRSADGSALARFDLATADPAAGAATPASAVAFPASGEDGGFSAALAAAGFEAYDAEIRASHGLGSATAVDALSHEATAYAVATPAPATAAPAPAPTPPAPATAPALSAAPAATTPAQTPAAEAGAGATAPAQSAAERQPRRVEVAVQRELAAVGIGERLSSELVESAMAHVLPFEPRTALRSAVRTALQRRIPTAAPIPARGAAIAFVGPGGSGKTRSVAALSAAYRKAGTLPVGCASVLGGADGQPLRMILSPRIATPTAADSPLAMRALASAREQGIALIDTPSVSPADRSGIRALAKLLCSIEPDRVVVALPATLSAAAAEQLLQALAPLKPNAVAITHADETDQVGVAAQAACSFGLAPEYLLSGARGSKALTRIDSAALAGRLLP